MSTPKKFTFFAQGLPKAQPRPRAFAKRMGDKFAARVYDPGTAEGWKSCVALAARSARPPVPLDGAVRADLTFFFPRPKSHFQSGKKANCIKPGAPFFHISKPDADNLAKAVLDAMTQIGGWGHDDSQVIELNISKVWCIGESTSGVFAKVGSASREPQKRVVTYTNPVDAVVSKCLGVLRERTGMDDYILGDLRPYFSEIIDSEFGLDIEI